MSHIAFARKYRPRSFGDVTSQEHVSETLRRAVTDGRVGHAYLFCGPRGVGKTTLARVLAMALNCGNCSDKGEPCGNCDSCSRVWSGKTALDVVEIDAASNRGVDDARQLRERAMYAPSQDGSHKVYIVDEAHMLTREAWNALLKILEEPPPRVIFVFATTEPQKIQQTVAPILSRCQRFDFHRIGVKEIAERLKLVVTEEGFSCSEEAMTIIARKAEGGMRDALSILDQVVALTGGEITEGSVTRILGLVEHQVYLDTLDIIINRKHGEIFTFVQDLSDKGYDFVEFHHGLVGVLRNLLQLSLGGVPAHLVEERVASLRVRSSQLKASDLVRMLALASDLESSGSLKRNVDLQLVIEMFLLKLSYMERTIKIEELLRKIGDEDSRVLEDRDETIQDLTGDEVSGNEGESISSEVESLPEVSAVKLSETKSIEELAFPEIWSELIEKIEGIPRGGKPFLRACRTYKGEDGAFMIHGPSQDVIGRIKEEYFQRSIETFLRERLGEGVEIIYVADAETKIIPELSQRPEERLNALIEEDPGLGKAVEELNLELLD